jgi:hypothetical protein
MKLLKTNLFWVMATIVVFAGYLSSCTKENQILDLPTVASQTDLVSAKTTTPPVIDGSIDGMWGNCAKLQFNVEVPDPESDIFRSYVGKVITGVTFRSAYDADNIYFLAEWSDPTQTLLREPWYFDPSTRRWAQEVGSPTFGPTGAITRPAFYEDKLAMLWNVDNSVTGWNSATCYKSCHTGLSATDGFGRHHTNSLSERIDMWHWKMVRTGAPNGQIDDQYQDNTYPNGRLSDDKISGGYTDNVQTLVITGTTTSVTVPKYFIPGMENYYWILQSEVDAGSAKLITEVDSLGILTYNGGAIDPTTDLAFQRNGTGVGTKVIPSIYTAPLVGSRGDITCASIFTGTGWVVEFKRALKTGDTQRQDVDFSSLSDQYFGVGIFENAQIAHAIKANLKLTFEK